MKGMLKLFFISILMSLTSCASLKVHMAQSGCHPTFKNRIVSTVDRKVAFIRAKKASEGLTSKSVVLEYDEPGKNTVEELRCLLVSESNLNKDDEILMVTAVFTKANVVQHFLLDRTERIYIGASFNPIGDNREFLLGTAEILFPLEKVLDHLADSKSKYEIELIGRLQQPFVASQVMDLVSKLSDGKLLKQK